MGPWTSIVTALRKSFTLSGRATPREFWWMALFSVMLIALLFQLVAFVVAFPIGFKEGFAAQQEKRPFSDATVQQTYAIYARRAFMTAQFCRIFVCIPLIAAAVRRLHDTGRRMLLVFSIIPCFFIICGLSIAYGVITGSDIGRLGFQIGQNFWLVLLVSSGPLIWVLTRPSQPGINSYGPNPSEAST